MTTFCFIIVGVVCNGTVSLRVTVLAAICITQAFMMWKFINFQLRRWREHAQTQTLKKKSSSSKSKSKKGQYCPLKISLHILFLFFLNTICYSNVPVRVGDMTDDMSHFRGCFHFILPIYWHASDFLPTVYIHLRHKRLHDYVPKWHIDNFVCIWPSKRRKPIKITEFLIVCCLIDVLVLGVSQGK